MGTRKSWLFKIAVVVSLLVWVVLPASGEIIIDNGDADTSSTGKWLNSDAPGAYGTGSVYSGDLRTYTWKLNCPETAEYEVSMWWTEWPSRATRAKVLVACDQGTRTVYVNQRENGGKWNDIGKYPFTEGKTYKVTMVAAPGKVTTCADAVRFVKVDPPAAEFSADRFRGPAPMTVRFLNHTGGEADTWHWDFGDGTTSTEDSPSHTYTKAGVYTVMLTASGKHGVDTRMRYSYIDVKAKSTENVYVFDGYGGNDYLEGDMKSKMWQAGATEAADGWVCRPAGSGMTYNIYLRRDNDSLRKALYEDGAHVVICGHANYGYGLVFASKREILEQRIDDYDCIDSSRLFSTGTQWVSAKVDGMKYAQAYPNWKTEFNDGTKAVAPFDFGDARGVPPYNYCLTYQLAGDPYHYWVEVEGKRVERFGDSGAPAWYSAEGRAPDLSVDRACFIRNTAQYYNRFDFEGEWPMQQYHQQVAIREESPTNYNYRTQWPGLGTKRAKWSMVLKRAGQYRVLATWPALPENATNARYKIYHAKGTSVAYADQTQRSDQASLGVYNFRAGLVTVEMDDKADGYVVADAVILRPMVDAEKILFAEFSVDKQSGAAPLEVEFTDRTHHYTYNGSAEIAKYEWDFGDGKTSTSANPLHTYAKAGVYTVRLRVTTTDGGTDVREKKGFVVVGGKSNPAANFRASTMRGVGRLKVRFYDESTGDIGKWIWDFGDGKSSEARHPEHTYTAPGKYSVRLRVYGPTGQSVQIKRSYIHVFTGECYTDNTFRDRPHYTSGATTGKVICYAGPTSFEKDKLKYARMFHSSCNSMPYFGGVFNRGLMYGKTGDVRRTRDTAPDYLVYYLQGYTDEDILKYVNGLEDNHAFYNFSEKPPSVMLEENEALQF